MTIVRVETDEGVVGIGSGDTMDGFEAFEHLFVGQDPLAIARHVRVLETIDFHAGRYWPLEAALWDVIGQVAGLPVANLFGGATDGIPAYASCGTLLPAAARAESALRLREEGFRALKIRIDPRRLDETAWRPWPRRGPRSATPWRSWSTSTRAGGWPATRPWHSTRSPLGTWPPSSPPTTSCGWRSLSPARICEGWLACGLPGRACASLVGR